MAGKTITKGGDDKPRIDTIVVGSSDDTITWDLGQDYQGEFRIWFPPETDPLQPGHDMSNGKTLTRKLKKVRRGNGDHYPYSIYLIEANQMVESASPPEVIIQ